MIDYGLADRNGPPDHLARRQQRQLARRGRMWRHMMTSDSSCPLAARYLLLSTLEPGWNSLAIYADDNVVGHAMWAMDDDGAHWIGGALIEATHQRTGIGRAAMQTLIRSLADQPD